MRSRRKWIRQQPGFRRVVASLGILELLFQWLFLGHDDWYCAGSTFSAAIADSVSHSEPPSLHASHHGLITRLVSYCQLGTR